MPDKTLIIFGPGEHFGFSVAQRFAKEGFYIVFIARDEGKLEALQEALHKEGISVSMACADVRSQSEVIQAVAALKGLPPVTAVIYNVKAGARGNGLSVTPEELTDALAANVGGALAAIQASLPILKPGSSIILTGGGYKDKPDPEKLALSVSKGALHTLFLSMIRPLKSRGITLKTLIIDGMVREEGPIRPENVAQAFWDLYTQESNEPMFIRK